MSNVLHALSLNFITSLLGMHNSLCVSENKTETQRGLVTCPRLHSK